MRVGALSIYPVKGCYRIDVARADVRPWGVDGDRRFAVLDTDDRALTQRDEPGLVRIKPRYAGDRLILSARGHPDCAVTPVAGELVSARIHRTPIKLSLVDAAADRWLAEVLGRPARLAWLDDPTRRPVNPAEPDDPRRVHLADGYPVLLANAASLHAVNDWLAEAESFEWPIPMTRFRPNIVVDGAPAWAEDGWLGRRLRIGAATFAVDSHCGRCVVTTTDQDSGDRGHEPLRTLGRHRQVGSKLAFAVQLVPVRPGAVAVGDAVAVLE